MSFTTVFRHSYHLVDRSLMLLLAFLYLRIFISGGRDPGKRRRSTFPQNVYYDESALVLNKSKYFQGTSLQITYLTFLVTAWSHSIVFIR